MKKKVIKRDGTKQNFQQEKVTNAILKAMRKCEMDSYEDALTLTNEIIEQLDFFNSEDDINIKDIEKIVEYKLMCYNKTLAREYIGYRKARDFQRNKSMRLFKKITGLLDQSDESIISENANKDSKIISTQRDLLAGIVSREIISDLHYLPNKIEEYKGLNYLHFHDEDYSPLFPMYNCMLINYSKMFDNNFIMNNAIIETPKSFQVACTTLTQIIASVASSIYGGQTINRIDEGLSKYVTHSYYKIVKDMFSYLECFNDKFKTCLNYISKKFSKEKYYDELNHSGYININAIDTAIKNYLVYDVPNLDEILDNLHNKIDKIVFDGIQTIEYQVNTISSSNGQTPFLTINFGLSTSFEGRLIQKNILKVRQEGIGKKHITPVFPKLIFTLCKGINFFRDDPNYDIKVLAMETASKRLYPDILNYENICKLTGGKVIYKLDSKGREVPDIYKSTGFKAPMGCRSFLGYYEDESGKEENEGRNNNGVISINLVRVALESIGLNDDKKETDIDIIESKFFEKLDNILEVIKEGLLFRVHRLEHCKANIAPILYGNSKLGLYGATGKSLDPEEEIGNIFGKRSSLSLGYIGLYETVIALYGTHAFNNEDIIEKAKKIMKHLYDTTKVWTSESDYTFSVYGTPAENLSGKFEKKDKADFGIIKGVTDRDWYTNSFHLDCEQKANAFEKIDYESNFVEYSTGGFTTMIDCNSLKSNPLSLEALWDYSYEKSKIGYLSINVKNDICFKCNYEKEFIATEEGYECPNCGNLDSNEMQVIRRISGYLTDATARKINKSKKAEIDNRVVHF